MQFDAEYLTDDFVIVGRTDDHRLDPVYAFARFGDIGNFLRAGFVGIVLDNDVAPLGLRFIVADPRQLGHRLGQLERTVERIDAFADRIRGRHRLLRRIDDVVGILDADHGCDIAAARVFLRAVDFKFDDVARYCADGNRFGRLLFAGVAQIVLIGPSKRDCFGRDRKRLGIVGDDPVVGVVERRDRDILARIDLRAVDDDRADVLSDQIVDNDPSGRR